MPAVKAQETDKEQSAKGEVVKFELSRHLARLIERSPDRALENYLKVLYQINPSGVVTPADLERYNNVLAAKSRSRIVAQFLHLDLDGDTVITPEEFKAVQSVQDSNARSRNKIFELNADTDNDGNISIKELSAYAKTKVEQVPGRRTSQTFSNVFVFDLNKDGKVDAKEISDAIKKISADPTLVAKKRPAANRSSLKRNKYGRRSALECKLPQVPSGADVVVVSGSAGAAASTVTVAGQDVMTTTGHLNIEAGKTPLYIFSHVLKPQIWRITGATERIAKFVVGTRRDKEHGGVVGLDADKIEFSVTGHCFNYALKAEGGRAKIMSAKIATLLQQPVEKLIADRRFPTVHIPSGRLEEDKAKKLVPLVGLDRFAKRLDSQRKSVKKFDSKKPRLFKSSELNSFVEIDPKAVVSPKLAVAYRVMPGRIGLNQLVEQGALEYTSDQYYWIKKPFDRFPGGLSAIYGMKFILGKGIKLPAGDTGHSSVYSEETGECLTHRARCR
ncbi:MAG: EF-hand domain-containing protein [Hyphomicrobiales bacterium]